MTDIRRPMPRFCLGLIAWLFLPLAVVAASFDCTKATTSVEKMVCADPDLSRLDDALALVYATAAESGDHAELQRSQRRWLALRNACKDRACVKAAYEARLHALAGNCDPQKGMVDTDLCFPAKRGPDPFDDNRLTCAEMRRYPDRIFGDGIDLGSGSGSPIEVDYSCKESLASLPFLQKLKHMTEVVRSDHGPQTCTGTIVHAQWRYYHFDLLMAGFAPHKLLEMEARDKDWSNLYPQGIDANLFGYFERWAYESIYNFELHRAYMEELARARSELARHYTNSFRLSRQKAEQLAHLGSKIFVERAAGSFPRDSIPETQRILQSARVVRGSPDQLRSGLEGMYVDYVRIALNIALLTQRSASHVALLAERAESLNFGDESPLFFALRNMSNVRFLLERGADVNYRNGFGKTPLFYAIAFNDHGLVELLLDRGAAVNHRYSNPQKDEFDCRYQVRSGRTPLMHAAQHADVPMLKLLLGRGARVGDVDDAGENATAYALRHDRQDAATYLKSLGLAAPKVEDEVARRRKSSTCLDAATRKKLQGKAFSEFYGGCMRG